MASQSAEVGGQIQAEIRRNDNHHLAHSTLNKVDLAWTSQATLESRAEEAVRTLQQEEDGEEDAEDWNNDQREEESADWTPSDPSSEEEDGRTSNSGYMLLPQDAEPGSTENGDDVTSTVEVELGSLELNTVETVTPRMSKWLQKQVEDTRQGHCDGENTGANWATFSDPSPGRGSNDWPASAVHSSTVETLQPIPSTAVEQVKPHATMEEGMVYII